MDLRRTSYAQTPAGPWPAGWTVEYVEVTGSTNAELLASAGDRPDRSVRAAGHQTEGKGRLDRRWDAPPGVNLLVSILFHAVPEEPGELTRRVGLAAIDACPRGRRGRGRAEVAQRPPRRRAQAGRHPRRAGAPAGRSSSAWGSTWVGHPTVPPASVTANTPLDVLRAVLTAYDRLPADITERYRDALSTLGRRVRVELADGALEGTATDVEPDGRLVDHRRLRRDPPSRRRRRRARPRRLTAPAEV